MPGFLRQATAAQSRALGPFVDETDFKTAETALTIANTDIKLVVNGGASANKNSGGGTHRVNGVYGVTFDATDTATVGEMEVSVVVAGALSVFDKFTVVEEAVYDALYAAAAPGYVANAPVNMAQVSGDAAAADSLETMLDGTGGQVLSLKQLNIVNATGDALVASSTGGNGHGFNASGHGTGAGLFAKGGATGAGQYVEGGDTSGNGLHADAVDGSGFYLTGGGSGDGITALGSSAGMGAHFLAGTGSNLHGLGATGDGSGSGLAGNGGATGAGLAFGGGVTSGVGIYAGGSGNDPGLLAEGSGTGPGVEMRGGASGAGLILNDVGAISEIPPVDNLAIALVQILITLAVTNGAVATDGSNSAASFKTNLTETANDHWKDAFLLLTSGVLVGQVRKITAYNGTTKFLTVSGGFTSTPADAVTFSIVNR